MANLTDENVTPYLDPSLVLPEGVTITAVAVLTATGFFFASLPQVRAALATGTPPANQKPEVRLAAVPTAGIVGQKLTLYSNAKDADGYVKQVEFFLGRNSIGVVTTAPYLLEHTPNAVGVNTYTALVTDNAGATTQSEPLNIQVSAGPLVPGTVSISAVQGSGSLQLVIDKLFVPADNGSPLIGYNLYTPGQSLPLATGVQLPYTYTAPAVGQYSFQAKAVNAIGEGPFSNVAGPVLAKYSTGGGNGGGNVVVPDAPTNVVATGGNNSATVTWTAPANTGGSVLAGYNIYRNGGTLATATNVLDTSYTDTGATNGTPTTYRVSAVNSAGEGQKSTASAAVTPAGPAGAPTNLFATATTSSNNPAITVTGTKPASTGGTPITNYNVYRDNGPLIYDNFVAPSGTALSYTDGAVVNGVPHVYQFAAVSAAGEGAKSAASNAATPTGPPVAQATAYVGALATTSPTASDVQALTSQQWDKSGRSLSIASSGGYPAFAEPQSQGIRQLSDKNGFSLSEGNDYSRTALQLTVGGLAVDYWLYEHLYAQNDSAFIYTLAPL